MTLTVGRGPLGHQPAAIWNKQLPELDGLFFLDPFPRRIRAKVDEETVVDSRQVQMLHEHGLLPRYYFPGEDVRTDLLEPSEKRTGSENKGETRWWHLRVGERLIEDAAWEHFDPPADASPLAGLISFRWEAADEWYEEDELAIVHARDPYHRVDVLDTSREVKVSLDGEPLAETSRARVLFETGLPPRWYIPHEDIREGILIEGGKRTGCAYKGYAHHLAVQVGDLDERDLAWTYPEPRREVEPIAGYVCFYNERVEIELDGEVQEQPFTPFHPDWGKRGMAPVGPAGQD